MRVSAPIGCARPGFWMARRLGCTGKNSGNKIKGKEKVMSNETEMSQVFEAGLNQAETRSVDVGGEPFVLVPKETAVVGLEKYLAQPLRKRGKVNLGDVESFVRYVEMHKQSGSRIYADRNPTGVSLVCVLDDHEGGNEDRARAGWKQHTASYMPR